jgi:alkanesulfonate monooxygenase SsuD/methylene tetrahydromethanopterin reductase-like flavin-dependent oxidoreductase (luciferase family)
MRFGLHVPNFAEPMELVDLGVTAEAAGWDGVFLWDHVFGSPAFAVPIADPWVVLGALAARTERVRLGTAVTPVARRRPQKLAREAVTLDRLSGGRAVLGVGLGNPPEEHTAFGEPADPATLAARLDEGLEVVAALWNGEPVDHQGDHFTAQGAQFLPPPVQQPRIPVWAACVVPHTAPLARAARWDGVILAALTAEGGLDPLTPDQVRRVCDEVAARRDDLAGYDVVVVTPGVPDGETVAGHGDAGATWMLVTGWMDQLRDLAASGPPA